MSKVYVWQNNRVNVVGDITFLVWKQYENCYAYDPNDEDDPWGMVVKRNWMPVELDRIPKEFRTQLLLMELS